MRCNGVLLYIGNFRNIFDVEGTSIRWSGKIQGMKKSLKKRKKKQTSVNVRHWVIRERKRERKRARE